MGTETRLIVISVLSFTCHVYSTVSSKDEQSSIAFETLGGIFGFVALVLVTAFLVFILKHRAKSKKEGTSVLMFRKSKAGSDKLRT